MQYFLHAAMRFRICILNPILYISQIYRVSLVMIMSAFYQNGRPNHQNIIKMVPKVGPKSEKIEEASRLRHHNPKKSTKIVPRSAPQATLEASQFYVGQEEESNMLFLLTFGATWAILGGTLGPAGRQGAPKIELFRTKSLKK